MDLILDERTKKYMHIINQRPDEDGIMVTSSNYNETVYTRKDCMLQFVGVKNYHKLTGVTHTVEREIFTDEEGLEKVKVLLNIKGSYQDGEEVSFYVKGSFCIGDEFIVKKQNETNDSIKVGLLQMDQCKVIDYDMLTDAMASDLVLSTHNILHGGNVYYDYNDNDYNFHDWYRLLQNDEVEGNVNKFPYKSSKESITKLVESLKNGTIKTKNGATLPPSLPEDSKVFIFAYRLDYTVHDI